MQLKQFYNQETKLEFLNKLLSQKKSYAHTYNTLFNFSDEFEKQNNKDLYSFTSKDLLVMYNSMANSAKYSSVLNYNSLIKNYKQWALELGKGAIMDTCTAAELKSIKNFKKYVILNDIDIKNMTEYAVIDGSDYNFVLFLKLFWESDGQESVNDVLSIKIEDLDADKGTIKIHRNDDNAHCVVTHEYQISEWLTGYISEFAVMTEVEFRNKNGSYKILTAEENGGFIFRTVTTKKTISGTPISSVKFSKMLNQYCEKHLPEIITVNDLLMSLALKHMVSYMKSYKQMYTEQRYFKNLSSHIYRTVLEQFGKEKYPDLYEEYLMYERKIGLR